MRITSRCLSLACLIAAIGCGSAEPSSQGRELTRTSRAAIEGGQLDQEHEAVFFLMNRSVGAMCTSTLIAPNLLLTARHCVAPTGDEDAVICGRATLGTPYDGTAFRATNEAEPSRTALQYRGRVKGVRVPAEGADTCGYDMAMLILDSNVPATVAKPAVPRIDQPVKTDEKYSAIGYGVDASNDWTGGRMLLTGLTVECEPGLCGFGVESTEFRGDHGTCSGDSGGPALDVHGRVLGVVSRAAQDCGSPIYGTVHEWREWITSVAKEAAQLGGYEPPSWVTTGRTEPAASTTVPTEPKPTEPVTEPVTPEPITPKGEQGAACSTANECADAFACYSPDGQASSAYCTARCSESVACGTGLECVPQLKVCLAPTRTVASKDSSGCSVSAPNAPPASGALAALGLGLVALRSMRRRRRAR